MILAALESFRVEKTNKRRVYSFSEQYGNYFRSKTDYGRRALTGMPDALVTEADLASPEHGKMLRP